MCAGRGRGLVITVCMFVCTEARAKEGRAVEGGEVGLPDGDRRAK